MNSPLDAEMLGIFSRTDELLEELAEEYRACVQKESISERAKNLFHEVLLKIRTSIEFLMRRTFDKYTILSSAKRETAQVFFAICDKKEKFLEKLKRVGLDNLESQNRELFAELLNAQPFSTKRMDLLYLRDLTNLGKHVRFAAQHCDSCQATQVTGPHGSVAYSRGVTFGRGVQIMGAPIDPETQRIRPTPGVKSDQIRWVFWGVDGYPIRDPVLFCRQLLQDTRRFVERSLNLLEAQ